MTHRTVGVVDYGAGNQASVRHSLHRLGLRCRVTSDPAVLDACDLLLLPGVGAFPPAAKALKDCGLDRYLLDYAGRGRPLVGICLGMQLLAAASQEDGRTEGLGLIPGEVVALEKPRWHIGWNTLEDVRPDPIFTPSAGKAFFFNHSYAYRGPEEFQVCRTRSGADIVAAVRRDNVLGVQFHPEKSQEAGLDLLRRVIEGLCDA